MTSENCKESYLFKTKSARFFLKNGTGTRDSCYHNTCGPAIIIGENRRAWYLNGKLHREDGPAYEISGPEVPEFAELREWYYNGNYVKCDSQEQFERIIKIISFI